MDQLFERIKTEVVGIADGNCKVVEKEKRSGTRRMCKVKSKQQFFNEYRNFLSRKDKEGVDEMFRAVKREMKVSQQKNEGGMFYENIKKEALNKIDYMYSNQRYYDHYEVKHLQSVIASCNILIHKKHTKIDAKPLYNVPKKTKTPLRMPFRPNSQMKQKDASQSQHMRPSS